MIEFTKNTQGKRTLAPTRHKLEMLVSNEPFTREEAWVDQAERRDSRPMSIERGTVFFLPVLPSGNREGGIAQRKPRATTRTEQGDTFSERNELKEEKKKYKENIARLNQSHRILECGRGETKKAHQKKRTKGPQKNTQKGERACEKRKSREGRRTR